MTFPLLVTYIDPGTGSMLFTILVGVLGAGLYAARNGLVKLRFLLSGGRAGKKEEKRLPIVIFSDNKRYWNVFEPICREFERRGEELHYLTASEDDPALRESFEHVHCAFLGEGNRAFARLNMLRADVLLATTPGLDVYQWKRSRDVSCYVHVPHACSDIVLYRMFGIDYYDAILLSGDYQIRQVRELEKLRGLPEKELRLAGITYMDSMRSRLERAEPLPPHPTTVLLAPSWGKSAILSRYGAKMLDALLDSGFEVIVRPHPQSFISEKEMLAELMARYPDSEHLHWNRDLDNFEVLRRSDLLISDFSGVIFDFALVFDKPVIYADTSFDRGVYDAWQLKEEPLWCFEILPKIGRQLTEDSFGKLPELVRECLDDPRFQQGRDEARAETWVPMGGSAARVTDYLLEKRRQVLDERLASREKDAVK